MAQKRFYEYKTPATSFEQGLVNQGLLPPGVYHGFDTITDAGGVGINLTVSHDGDAFKTIDDSLSLSANTAVCVTPQGKVIHIEGAIGPLGISDGIANQRIDYIIMEHEHVDNVGGQDAVFSVIEGPSNGNEPVIPNPEKQILLAKVYIAPSATTFAGLTFEYPDQPIFGNLTGLAFLNKIQQFTATQAMFKEGTVNSSVIISGAVAHVTLAPDGQYYELPDFGNYPLGQIKFENPDGSEYPLAGTCLFLKCSHTFPLTTTSDGELETTTGFVEESDWPDNSYFNAGAGDILIVRYRGSEQWELVSCSRTNASAIGIIENEVDALQTDVSTLQSEMTAAESAITSLEGELDFYGYSLTGSILTGDNGAVISNFNTDDHQLNVLGDLYLLTINADFDIATAAPSTLSLNLSPINVDSANAKPKSVGYAIISGTGYPILIEVNGATEKANITRVDGSTFPIGNVKIYGQVIFSGQ